MAGLNNLYPPIIDTYMPAFVATTINEACRIYFALSDYNSLSDINSVWVSVVNQYTNETALVSPIELKVFNSISVDNTRSGDDKYYITLQGSDIKGGWVLNQLYKVQIRFCSQVAPSDVTMDWIVTNSDLFSEWSTICLIQGIAKPRLELKNFADSVSGAETVFTTLNNSIVGRVYFEDNEQLESYSFSIFKAENLETPIYNSGIIYTNSFNPNEVNHALKIGLTDGEKYVLKFTYTTASLYQETKTYTFSVIENGGEPLNANITAEQDEEDGRIKVHVTSATERFFGNLTIRRSTSDTNFTVWEDVHTTSIISDDFLDFTWYDSTVESGVWYKYGVQKRNSLGDRGLIVITPDPVMVTLQDIFLTRADRQLKIKFNPQISSFKKTLSESLTQTLGSKYPFIKRNGNIGYRQFSISGLISHFCDENNFFISEEELYNGNKKLYSDYNEINKITEYNDYTLERTFREKVQEFLYDNTVKLFRSPSEGNILVKLMDINFTPTQNLGRMIYNFSATAYEIDDISFENFDKYGIQEVGTWSEQVTKTYYKKSQYTGTVIGNLSSSIQEWEGHTSENGLQKTILYFNSLDLEIQSEPYLIDTTSEEEPIKLDEENGSTNEGTVYGYIIKINGAPIIIRPRDRYVETIDSKEVTKLCGRYSILEKDNFQITSLEFPYETTVSLDYSCYIKESEDTSSLVRQVYYIPRVGQLWDSYLATDSITEAITKKYTVYNKDSYQRVFSINSIKIEAEPGTVFYIKDSSSNKYRRYCIGNTGMLNIEDKHYSIDGCYILGKNLSKKPDNQEITRSDEYTLEYHDEKIYDSVKDIKYPVENGVYLVNRLLDTAPRDITDGITVDAGKDDYCAQLAEMTDRRKNLSGKEVGWTVIYYRGNWYHFTENEDVIMTIPAVIDYRYELERGEY